MWPWLTQVGWHLGGWYTPRWVDRLLFPDNWPSLDHLDPRAHPPLAVGDRIPDGPPGTAVFVVEQVEPERLLLLRSTTHLPPAWAGRRRDGVDLVLRAHAHHVGRHPRAPAGARPHLAVVADALYTAWSCRPTS